MKFGELVALLGVLFAVADDEEEILGEDEGHAFAVEAELFLEMPQKVAKVDVEDLAVLINHDIVGVAVADAQDLEERETFFFNVGVSFEKRGIIS